MRVLSKWAAFVLGILFTLVVVAGVSFGLRLLSVRKDLLVFSNRLDLRQILQSDRELLWTTTPNMKKVEIRPSSQNTPITFKVSTNSQNLRGPELGEKGARKRILAIGDSTTFGQYVEDEETWPAQLQSILDKDAETIEVVNAGVIGATSFQGLNYLVKRGFDLKPDAVLATYGFNEHGRWAMSDREVASFAQQGVLDTLARRVAQKWRPEEAGDRPRVSPGEYLDLLVAMAKLCEERGVALYLLLWPWDSQVTGPCDVLNHSAYQGVLIEACQLSNARLIDLRCPMHDCPRPALVDEIHGSPAGCRIVAETVATKLKADLSWCAR